MKAKKDTRIEKILTVNGNYFIYEASLGGPIGKGYYVTPEGDLCNNGRRVSAASEIQWMEDNWEKKPLIEVATEKEAQLFSKHFIEEETPQKNFKPAQDTPFAGLADLLSKGG
jgi:hypothetical protein